MALPIYDETVAKKAAIPPASVEEEIPIEEPEAIVVEEEPPIGGGLVSPEAVRYFGPEGRCKNCTHFMEPDSCEVVSGVINPEGRCCVFEADVDEAPEEPEETMEGY